jgi:transaldolase
MPEKTLLAFGDHGAVDGGIPSDGGDCESVLSGVTSAGIDLEALAARLQIEGRDSFDASWHSMISDIAAKTESVAKA